MRTGRIQADDVVEVLIRGRRLLGRVTEISDGVVYSDPICQGAGWRHAKAREIVAHWRKTGRRGGGEEDETDVSTPIDEQLSLGDATERVARARSAGQPMSSSAFAPQVSAGDAQGRSFSSRASVGSSAARRFPTAWPSQALSRQRRAE